MIREWRGSGTTGAGSTCIARRAWSPTRLAGGPHRAARRRCVHRRGDACFALGDAVLPRDTNVLPRSRSGPATPSTPVGRRSWTSGGDLPRARAALQRVPTRGRMPLPRSALRAAAQAGALRRLVPAAPRENADAGRGRQARAAAELDAEAVVSLERDGLVERVGDVVRLPG